jgi:phospholipid/cholesterol/gamma-HCH transport system substrate-binding protein
VAVVDRPAPPYKAVGAIALVLLVIGAVMLWGQFRGAFTTRVGVTLVSPRAGLVVDPGSKVTLNGVEIGRVGEIAATSVAGVPHALLTLRIDPRYLHLIPANVSADIKASTVFGNKYIALRSPEDPSPQRLSAGGEITASWVSTEFNTLFETVMAISERVDPVKLNQTLTAAAQALGGMGADIGRSLADGSAILERLNTQMPQFRRDLRGVTALADIYAEAAPDLLDGLAAAALTAGTLDDQRGAIDDALLAAIGFSDTAGGILERGGPYLVRAAQDLIPTSQLFDHYSPQLLCTIRNYHDAAPLMAEVFGGDNGYSLASAGTIFGMGVPNTYVFPDNLPRVNARGGPGGRPGCWQKITRELWPAPYLVMDTGLSIAPYNHFELGQPIFTEYVWGRQIGAPTINP